MNKELEIITKEPLIQFFYYDPILGLSYFTDDSSCIKFDLNAIPYDFNKEKWLSLMRSTGIQIIDSFKTNYPVETISKIISNF